jgi:TonB family protein
MRVLLVDHDSEALETVTRAIRGVLELDCVTSKGDALLLLRQNTYDVLIACERCVDGSGLDLLGRTTRTAVPLKRIFAAPPERLQLLGPRLAPFKVQRTINYPIDLEELWLAIAQVTSGPEDETDGTIERVVLDERGIPAVGSVPRSSIPPRPPAPFSAVPTAAVGGSAAGAAIARLTQPAPEPPLQPPPPPRAPPPPVARAPAPPNTTSDTGRLRNLAPPAAPVPPAQPAPPMAAPALEEFPGWSPEPQLMEDYAEVAAQARFGVQPKVSDETSRRKRNRVMAACAVALVVASTIVLLIENFYDPQARAREKAIAAQIELMNEQRKASDNLALIEFEIENAIIRDDLVTARRELAVLVEKAPNHPRLEFLRKSIDRTAALARLSPQDTVRDADQTPAQAAVLPSTGARAPAKPDVEQNAKRNTERSTERADSRSTDRSGTSRPREASLPPASRTYGAPIGESARQSLPLDAPINAPPVTTIRRNDNSFPGRTVEASDSAVGRAAPPPPVARTPAPRAIIRPPSNASGSAAVPMANAPAAAPEPPAPLDVVPARIVKRVTPMAPGDIPAKTKGYVVVRFSIGVNGRVGNLEVVESDPQGVFDDAAQDAVRKWIYEPRTENGVAVESSAKARLVFDAAN